MMEANNETGETQYVRPEEAAVAESAITLAESLLTKVIGTLPKSKTAGAVRNLTICGMSLAAQHARGAVAEFVAVRSYSGIATPFRRAPLFSGSGPARRWVHLGSPYPGAYTPRAMAECAIALRRSVDRLQRQPLLLQ